MRFEYITIAAPMRSEKTKGAKTPVDRYAATLTDAINVMARDGWEYLRAETLPSEERSGLTGRTTLFHNLLIFRREIAAVGHRAEVTGTAAAPAPTPVSAPVPPRTEPARPVPADAAGGAPAASPVFSETMRLSESFAQDGAAPAPKSAG